VEQVQI